MEAKDTIDDINSHLLSIHSNRNIAVSHKNSARFGESTSNLILRIANNYPGKHGRLVRYEALGKSYVKRVENSANASNYSYKGAKSIKINELASSLDLLDRLVIEC